MEINALNVRAFLMDQDSQEDEKILALAQMLESIDLIEAFPQLVTDALIAVVLIGVTLRVVWYWS